MLENLPSRGAVARAALNIVKAIGPFVISQADKASEAYARHQLRLAHVDACKEAMISEIRVLSEIKKKLVDRYFDTPEEERFKTRRDIGELEREIRRLGVYEKAVQYLPKESADRSPFGVSETEGVAISPSWIDRFDEIARTQNEGWRQELLSRALALEAQEPGCIGPRALWFIGTIDDHIFHAFASLIDVSSIIYGKYIVPNHVSYLERVVPNCALGENVKLGNVTFMLNDLGLTGDLHTSQRIVPGDGVFQIRYGSESRVLRTKRELRVHGLPLTYMGEIVASLYEQKPNELGKEIFETWIKSLGPDSAEVQGVD